MGKRKKSKREKKKAKTRIITANKTPDAVTQVKP